MISWKDIFWRNINTYTCLIKNTLGSKYDWNIVSVGSCINPKGIKVPGKVLKQDYNSIGKYPIISQSKTFIEGYSDLTEFVINNEDGLVVFGDHTRVLKYVSIPFIIGADGVKVIMPNEEFIPKFFFYLLHSIDIEGKDYGRHYKLLRFGKIVQKENTKDVQKLIVRFLDNLEQNKLSSKIYFDESCEKQILSIQKKSINCSTIHAEITRQQMLLKKLRQSILQDAISGKLTEKWRRENPCLPAPESGKYWVYVIKCSDGSNYIGQTRNLIERYSQHLDGIGSEWTKKHRPEYVMYWECFSTRAKAVEKEKWLKTGFGRKWIKRKETAGKFWHAGEPASELLARIKAEKERLVKEKKIKKPKPLPPIAEDEIPFALPEGWVWCRLENLSNSIHYGATKSAKKVNQGIRLLRITDIQGNKVSWDSVPWCNCSQKDIEKYNLSENDILIARTGGTIGKSYLVNNMSVDSIFASYLIRVIPDKHIQPEYLKRYLESPSYWVQLYEAAWGAGQPNVNGTKLKSLFVSLPPLPEQKAIVTEIEKLFTYCDELEKQINKSQQDSKLLMQAVLKEAFEC